MLQLELGSCTYEVDAQLHIVTVDERWSQFAIANSAPDLAAPQPVGQSLLAHIADRTTAELYERLFAKVQLNARGMVVPFRCDSPFLRRFLELKIDPRQPDGLCLQSTLLRVEPRPEVRLLDPLITRAGEALRMCSFCKRVEALGQWHEVEHAVIVLRLFDYETLPPITHGVCPACYENALTLLDG